MKMLKFINLVPFEPKSNYDLSHEKEITILIKTLEREEHLIQLLNSIQNFHFEGPIIIGDDSKVTYGKSILNLFPDLNINYLELPYDTGTSEGRNRILSLVKTPFFLLCDDDFAFDRRTRLPLMKKLLKENQLDILGGVFRQYNRKRRKSKYLKKINRLLINFGWVLPSSQIYDYHASFIIDSEQIHFQKVSFKDPVTICDLTHNFFLARTDKVKLFGGWNPVLKGGEHQNFFIRAKLAGLKVGTTRLCGVIHDQWTTNSSLYQSLRSRGDIYKKMALKEFDIIEVIGYKEALGEDFFSK